MACSRAHCAGESISTLREMLARNLPNGFILSAVSIPAKLLFKQFEWLDPAV